MTQLELPTAQTQTDIVYEIIKRHGEIKTADLRKEADDNYFGVK